MAKNTKQIKFSCSESTFDKNKPKSVYATTPFPGKCVWLLQQKYVPNATSLSFIIFAAKEETDIIIAVIN